MGVIITGGAALERASYWDSEKRPIRCAPFGSVNLHLMNLTPSALELGPAKFERELLIEFRLAFAELRNRYEERSHERAA